MKLNNRGFTLAELIVASAVGVIIAGIAVFAFVQAMEMFIRTSRMYEAENDMISAQYNMKSIFARAIRVQYFGPATTSFVFDHTGSANTWGTQGGLFRYDLTTCPTKGTYLIGVAATEMGNNTAASKFYGSGVWYQSYDVAVKSSSKSGAIFFDQEHDISGAGDTGGAWVKLSPINATAAYGRFTDFSVENIRVMNTNGTIIQDAQTTEIGLPVLSAEFRMTMRYFTRGKTSEYRWCPAALVSGTAACRGNTSYFDIEKRLKVVFANNALNDSTSYYDARPYGGIYFFKSIPSASRR